MSSEHATEVETDEPPTLAVIEEETDGGDEGEAQVEQKKPSAIPKLKPKRTATPRPLAELRNNETLAVKEWLESLSPQGAIKVKVTRTSPEMWRGLKVGGLLATYDRMIDEEWIRDRHGGGDYHLEVRIPNPPPHGGWKIAGHRDIHVAGDPRTDDVFRNQGDDKNPVATPAGPDSTVFKGMIGMMERQLERAQQAGTAQGMDPGMIAAILSPMQAQMNQMAAMLRDSQAALAQAQQIKPVEKDEIREKMFSALIDGDSARMVSMRTQHESEIRQLKQSAIDDQKRLHDQFERDKQQIVMSHDRELNALRSAYDMKVASQETMNATSKTLLDGEIRRLQADLTEAKSELAALRLKKDKTILEQASEFAAIKDAIGDITGSDKEEKSTLEKVIEAAGSLPAVQGMIGKLAGAEGGQPQQPVQQVQAPPQFMTGPDGHLYRQLPNGQMVLVRRRRAIQQPGQAQAAPGQDPSTPPLPDIAPATVKIAVDFLETAYRNGQDPTEVATSVRSMIPSDVLTAIRQLGIDDFLTKVAKLDGTSQLSNQAGRNWTRKLGKALVGE